MRLRDQVRLRLHRAYAAAEPAQRAQLAAELDFVRYWNRGAYELADRDPRRRGYGRGRGGIRGSRPEGAGDSADPLAPAR